MVIRTFLLDVTRRVNVNRLIYLLLFSKAPLYLKQNKNITCNCKYNGDLRENCSFFQNVIFGLIWVLSLHRCPSFYSRFLGARSEKIYWSGRLMFTTLGIFVPRSITNCILTEKSNDKSDGNRYMTIPKTRTDNYHNLSRPDQVTTSRLRTGHGRLRSHLFNKLNFTGPRFIFGL